MGRNTEAKLQRPGRPELIGADVAPADVLLLERTAAVAGPMRG